MGSVLADQGISQSSDSRFGGAFAVSLGMARTKMNTPLRGGVLPMPEAYMLSFRMPPYSGLKRRSHAAIFELRGSFRGKGAEPL